MFGATARLLASFKPRRSQGFVILTLLGGVFFGIATLVFAWDEHRLTWIPLSLCAVFLFIACISWFLSHKNADLEGGAPTVLIDKKSGLSFQTDTRLLMNHPGKIKDWVASLSVLVNKEPLPPAAGVIDSSGNIVPGSEGAANANVDEINASSEELIRQAVQAMSKSRVKTPSVDKPDSDPTT